jgi:hypothetical protein
MGSGYRVFTAGEVLSASNVQNYLQDQAVMVFGGTAARSSAIGTANFEEGMLTYLTDVDKLQVYTGAAFADVYPAAATNQGLTLINTTSFSGVASQSINDVFSATYDNYKVLIRLNASSVTSNAFFRLRVSGADNTSGVYYYMANYFASSSASVPVNANNATQWNLFQTGTTAASHIDLTIFNPFIAQKTTASGTTSAANASVAFGGAWAGLWDGTTSFTGFTIIGESGNLTGNVSVYGVNK